MSLLIKNASVFLNGGFSAADVLIRDGIIAAVAPCISDDSGVTVIDMRGKYVFPGFVDVHVHFREPGFSYKETIMQGTLAAAHGGYCSVCAMPNLNPVPDCAEAIAAEQAIIDRDAKIKVYPYAAITLNECGEELVDMASLASRCIAFSDDGKGVQSVSMMKAAMQKAASLGKIIAAHCEDNSLLCGGYIHKGEYALKHGHRGICSESEWKPIARDLELARQTGCAYHVCHISTKESVDLIRRAKLDGINVTCETAPHYLTLSDMCLEDDGRFKMNPPIRSEADRLALIEGVLDGTVDMIATDHAPHSAQEKSRGLEGSLMGVSGIECAFPVLYTELVMRGIITTAKLIELMCINPSRRFGIGGAIEPGSCADITVFDLDDSYLINPADFLSKGKSTPFEGRRVNGKCKMTVVNGRIIWQE